MENAIYFASVNYALRYQETATSVVAPDGRCVGFTVYGEEALLVVDLHPKLATGLYARRYAPERYGEWIVPPGNDARTFPTGAYS